ncbi:MAG: condensation domain-containing protein, partial [Bacillota bacterium]|nr:condensation domain-containing protein [Bacillota bacterium]
SSIKAYENQEYPYEKLIDKLEINGKLEKNVPLFNTMFTLQITDNTLIEVNGIKYIPYNYECKTSKFDIIVEAYPSLNHMRFDLSYSSKLFKRETIEKLSAQFIEILQTVISNENILIEDIHSKLI